MTKASSIYIVLTGAAHDRQGRPVLRAAIKAAATREGYVVQNVVNRDTHALIASRDDTIKARDARAKGLLTVTYENFLTSLGMFDQVAA